ncbi:MAG TPA: DUF2461 domain-containing protein [Acidimicrobiales bacterium]
MAFRGWPAEAIEFYEGLEADNSKTYWQAHKAEYEQLVQQPMQQLMAELAPEFGEGRIFRPYRDIRFSADKSPYKTAMAASLASGGYIQLSADGLGAGCGMYVLDADQLDRYRRAVVDDLSGAKLASIIAATAKRGIEVTAHETLKTAPRGFPRDHPRAELLRRKGLVTWKQWQVGNWLGTSQAKKRVVDFLRASAPLKEWLATHVA